MIELSGFSIDLLWLAFMAFVVVAFAFIGVWFVLWTEDKDDDNEPPLDGNVLLTTQEQMNRLMRMSFEDGMRLAA